MPKGGRSVKRSFLLKTLLVAALAMILMLPAAMIRDLVTERQARRNEGVSGIAEGWGKRQTVAGPYLAIPIRRASRRKRVQNSVVGVSLKKKQQSARERRRG